MNFRHVTLTVKDLDASIHFYTEIVGLPVDRRYQPGPDTEIAFLGTGETKVELICHRNQPDAIVGNAVSVGFEVEDILEKFESFKGTDISVVSDIIQPNQHVRFFFVADPDGFRVQFLESL
ncbi:MAG TPA: VOC family protein [Bacillota bacterium]|nr:VOC family protein [Bacillota bacterium]